MVIQSKHLISSHFGTGFEGLATSRLSFVVVLALAVLLPGCGKDPEADATAELAASFEGSPAKADVLKAKAAFEERRYKDSLKLLGYL